MLYDPLARPYGGFHGSQDRVGHLKVASLKQHRRRSQMGHRPNRRVQLGVIGQELLGQLPSLASAQAFTVGSRPHRGQPRNW